MKHRLLLILMAVVLLVATAVFFATRRDTTSTMSEPAHAEEAGNTGVKIAGLETAPVVMAPVTAQLTVTGEVQANEDQTAKVGSPVSGRLTQLSEKSDNVCVWGRHWPLSPAAMWPMSNRRSSVPVPRNSRRVRASGW